VDRKSRDEKKNGGWTEKKETISQTRHKKTK
jgi:hypothetical protein